jgi:hypothetical protein
VEFGFPSIIPRGSCSGHNGIFNFNGNKSLGAPGESSGGGVINVLDSNHSDGKLAAKRLAKVGHIDRVI